MFVFGPLWFVLMMWVIYLVYSALQNKNQPKNIVHHCERCGYDIIHTYHPNVNTIVCNRCGLCSPFVLMPAVNTISKQEVKPKTINDCTQCYTDESNLWWLNGLGCIFSPIWMIGGIIALCCRKCSKCKTVRKLTNARAVAIVMGFVVMCMIILSIVAGLTSIPSTTNDNTDPISNAMEQNH